MMLRNDLAKSVALAVAAGLLLLATPVSASAQPPAGRYVNLYNVVTGRCADLPNFGPGQPDGPVTQYACNYTKADNQRWRQIFKGTRSGRPVFVFQNRADRLCMDLPGYGSVPAGTPISEYPCARVPGNDNQLFYAERTVVRGAFKFVHVQTGLCLDVAGVRTGGDDARLTLWHCSDADDHVWALRRVRDSRAGTIDAVVATGGAPLRVHTAARISSPERSPSLHDGAPISIDCQIGTWDRLVNRGYVSDRFTSRDRRAAIPRCGGGPPEDLQSVLGAAQSFRELEAWWATLGGARQQQVAWRQKYALALKELAQKRALDAAGIGTQTWDPDQGLSPANDLIARSVYEYYARLFAQRPELQWAGMAKLAGGPVYAGMQDAAQGHFPGAETLERQLLRMQKAIFMDLAWQHQLFVDRGLQGLRRVWEGDSSLFGGDAGVRNKPLVGDRIDMIGAWEDIGSGDSGRIAHGNAVLIAREQDPVLQPYYDELIARVPAVAEMMTRCARSPIPGDQRFASVRPQGYVTVTMLNTQTIIEIGYHGRGDAMNVGWWEDRQRWVFGSMLPRYQQLLREDAEGTRELILNVPVQVRAEPYRLLRFDSLSSLLRVVC